MFAIVVIHVHRFGVPNVLMAVVLLLIHSLLLLPLFVGVLCLVLFTCALVNNLDLQPSR